MSFLDKLNEVAGGYRTACMYALFDDEGNKLHSGWVPDAADSKITLGPFDNRMAVATIRLPGDVTVPVNKELAPGDTLEIGLDAEAHATIKTDKSTPDKTGVLPHLTFTAVPGRKWSATDENAAELRDRIIGRTIVDFHREPDSGHSYSLYENTLTFTLDDGSVLTVDGEGYDASSAELTYTTGPGAS